MLCKLNGFALDGLDGYSVAIETDISNGLPSYELVGLASTATKESKERIRSAIKNSGYLYPQKRTKRKVRRSTWALPLLF